jgi:hypothetical protein
MEADFIDEFTDELVSLTSSQENKLKVKEDLKKTME